jgi:hypothetical protein
MALRIAALLLLLTGLLRAQTASDPGPTAAAMTPASSVAPTKAGAVSVWVTRAPEKSLRFEVDVPATIDEVWESMTTVKGMVTWLSPGRCRSAPGRRLDCPLSRPFYGWRDYR